MNKYLKYLIYSLVFVIVWFLFHIISYGYNFIKNLTIQTLINGFELFLFFFFFFFFYKVLNKYYKKNGVNENRHRKN